MKNIDETITTVFDRIEKYNITKKHKQKIAATIAIPVCACCILAVLGFGIGKSMQSPEPNSGKQTISVTVPSDKTVLSTPTLPIKEATVSDSNPPENITAYQNKIVIFSADGLVEQEMGIALFRNDFISMSDEEMIAYYGSNIFPEIPAGMTVRNKHLGIYKKENGTGEIYWDQNRQEYSNESETKRMIVDTKKATLPFYDFVEYNPETECSTINGHEVAIGQYSDGGYCVWFLYNDVGFYIYASGISENELISILSSLIV